MTNFLTPAPTHIPKPPFCMDVINVCPSQEIILQNESDGEIRDFKN